MNYNYVRVQLGIAFLMQYVDRVVDRDQIEDAY